MCSVVITRAKSKIKKKSDTGKYPKYSKDMDIRHAVSYAVSTKGKDKVRVRYWGTRGLMKDLKKATEGIIAMQRYLGSDKDRRLYHFIVTFREGIQFIELVVIVANALADYIGKDYQVVFGVHEDSTKLHIHLVFNSVNFRTGKKFHQSGREFDEWIKDMKAITEGILAEYDCARPVYYKEDFEDFKKK